MNIEEYRKKIKKAFENLEDYPEKKEGFINIIIEDLCKLEIIKKEYIHLYESRKELINEINKQGKYIIEQKELIEEQKKEIKRLNARLAPRAASPPRNA